MFILVQNTLIGHDPRSIHTLYKEPYEDTKFISYTNLDNHLKRYKENLNNGMVDETFPTITSELKVKKEKLHERLAHIEKIINGEVDEEFKNVYLSIDNILKKK